MGKSKRRRGNRSIPNAERERLGLPLLGRPMADATRSEQVKAGCTPAEKKAVQDWVADEGYENESDAVRVLIIEPAVRHSSKERT